MIIAIIDNGIAENLINIPNIVEKIEIDSKGNFLHGNKISCITHGTICANVINNYCEDIEIIDINIFGKNNHCIVENLRSAIYFCIKNSVKIIHMSVGTLNYHDGKKLEQISKEAYAKGIIIVAAYANSNIITYPAIYSSTVGVIADRYHTVNQGEILYLNNNNYVAHNEKKIRYGHEVYETRVSNSYAAPVITGKVAEIVNGNPALNNKQILSGLCKQARQKPYPEKIEKFINKKCGDFKIPSVGIDTQAMWAISNIRKEFLEEGFRVEVIENVVYHRWALPYSVYFDDNYLKQGRYTLEMIYDTDIFFFLFDYKMLLKMKESQAIDIIITCSKHQLVLYDNGIQVEYETVKEVFKYLVAKY